MKEQDKEKGHPINDLVAFGQQISKLQTLEAGDKRLREYLVKLGECFLNLESNPDENINRLVAIYGEFIGATCSLYNRLDQGMLCAVGKWRVPIDYKSIDKPDGHICYDVISHAKDNPYIVRNLQNTSYAMTDSNVSMYKLQTYVGMAVKFEEKYIGSLCAVFQRDLNPSPEEVRFMRIVVSAIAIEENHRQTQLKLQESSERDKLICETATDYVFTVRIKDDEVIETTHCPTCVTVTGYSPEEFAANPDLWINMVYEEDRLLVGRHVSLILAGRRVNPLEHRIVRKDGAVRWVRNTTIIHCDENGKLLSYTGLIQDITERKRIERELKKRQQDYEIILDSVPALIFYKDKENRMVHVNKAYAETMGLKKEQIEGRSCFELWSRDLAEHYWCDDREVIESGRPKLGIIEPMTTAKGELWVQTDKIPYRNERGDIVGVIGFAIDITDRRKAEQALKKERDKAQDYLDIAGVILMAMDTKGEVTLINKKGCEILGYTQAEIIGKNWFDNFLPLGFRERIKSVSHKLLSGEIKSSLYFENPVLTKAGQERIIAWHNALIKDEKGNITGHLSSGADITEFKLAEEALQESERKFRSLAEKSLVGIYVIQDGVLKYANPQFAEIFGYPLGEMVGKMSPMDLTHPEDRPITEEYIRKRINGEMESIHYSVRCLRKDNKVIFIEVYGSRIDYHNKPAIIGTLLDITERRKAEEALATSEEEYRTLVNNVNIGIFRNTPGPAGNFIKINPAMVRMFGYGSIEEFMKLKVSELYQDSRQRERFVEKLKQENFVKDEELRLKKKDGTFMWGSVTARLSYGSNGELKWLDGVIEDITERKIAEERLVQLNRELIRSNKRLSQLALRDPHTGLYNHRYLQDVIEAEFYRAKRYVHPFSVTLLDVDYFKSINDVYGHIFGDLVLKQLARQLKRLVRQYDIVIRFGGEEFMIISPGIDRSGALKLARRLLDAINLYNFGDKSHTVKLKFSVAVASYPEDKIVKGMDLVEITDQILNKVKEYGGNNVYSSLDIKKKSRNSSRKPKVDIGSLRERIDKLTKRTNQSLIEAVFAFAKTIELKDQYTGDHVEKTVLYATQISRALNLPEDEIERINQAAILHDLGKIGISEKILDKKSKLTKEEFEEIKKHPQIGVDIIRPIKFLHNIIPLILYHHERWDGKGYPSGLKGEEIPIGARIVAIADVYQALTSNRPYRKAYSLEEALKLIKKGSGSQFDPMVVTKFVQILKQKKEIE